VITDIDANRDYDANKSQNLVDGDYQSKESETKVTEMNKSSGPGTCDSFVTKGNKTIAEIDENAVAKMQEYKTKKELVNLPIDLDKIKENSIDSSPRKAIVSPTIDAADAQAPAPQLLTSIKDSIESPSRVIISPTIDATRMGDRV